MTDDFTSVLDKTDWKKVIQRSLEEAVMSIGKDEIFWYATERAVQAMSATYPNWDADIEVKKMYDEVAMKHNKMAEQRLLSDRQLAYEWAFSWNQDGLKTKWKNEMYREILQKLENIAGQHRMLLYGKKNIVKGSQMEIPGVDEEE